MRIGTGMLAPPKQKRSPCLPRLRPEPRPDRASAEESSATPALPARSSSADLSETLEWAGAPAELNGLSLRPVRSNFRVEPSRRSRAAHAGDGALNAGRSVVVMAPERIFLGRTHGDRGKCGEDIPASNLNIPPDSSDPAGVCPRYGRASSPARRQMPSRRSAARSSSRSG